MKRIYAIVAALMVLVTACDKEIPLNQQLKTLEVANIDANAGTWKPVLLATNAQVVVPPPAFMPGTPGYQLELDAVKTLQANLTDHQRKVVEYWSAGGVLRWNEILRGLVAKYNLPPAPLASGSYPAPDAANPFADPNFPFANPPYASRAYSYVTAAQYDAMKAAWYWKYQHNRQAPFNVANSGVEALVPKTALPGYPSEDAVLSGVTAEVMKLLFPAAVEEITLRAAEQRNAAMWAGKATATDVSAGLALGNAIATIFTDRAKTDGMGTAGGNKPLWDALKKNAEDRGEVAWQSLETPPRPPMLPFFGLRTFNGTNFGAKAWMMSNAQIEASRPLAPPPTGSEEMAEEVAEVKYYSKNVTRERLAIVHKWADGAGTYTPPGHWNEIASHYIEAANMSEVRAARAFAYLNIVMHDAAVGCWETKFFYFNPRPSQMDPSIKTATGVPNFPAYTSGHSTFSGGACTILSYLFPAEANFFNEQAQEASLSRMYGGIHYRKDCEMGLDHGKRIAAFTVDFATTDGAN